ncbi:CoA transferase [Desulfosarcina ovata subsp. sediminis]|uniref:CoA transferase n=1 Tax=Desulfosarcina ovata subsp. sediminis TaxID=885957 RepID=A0A5K7ZPY6_9BACT|nr:CoA transferase [Desulfosarcina ovata]BBO82029.1 CoA transferase [Desulfosarcina ovata subsp. sediminis]
MTDTNSANKVLEDITVLDFSRFAAGPYCTMLLADMGAQVIRVEQPGGGADREFGLLAPDGEAFSIKITARNKKGITLDILSDEGRQLLSELLKKADVIVHNFTLESAEAKVLNYDILSKENPALIMAYITGFGSGGPYASKSAFDFSAKAMTGAMWLNAMPGGGPVKEPVPYADLGTGCLAAYGIMVALHHRLKTGKGQLVDASLLDTAASFVEAIGAVALYSVHGEVRHQLGNHGFATYMNILEAKDGYIVIMPYGNRIWRRLCRLLEREDMITDPRFVNDGERQKNSEIIDAIMVPWCKALTVDEVLNKLDSVRVPAEKVDTIADFVNNPQVRDRNLIEYLEYPGVGSFAAPAVLPKLSSTPGDIVRLAPKVGEHNQEIYNGLLQLSEADLSRLATKGII